MAVERTFWEKATAAHVYCMQENMKKDRFSRHRHDLHYIHRSEYFDAALKDKELSEKVARHKSFFFAEKDKHGEYIDYVGAVKTGLKLVPSKDARSVLAEDYVLMKESGVTAPDLAVF
ncbi:nucleotidyl transferase AbiEii/AbiGii toxin family protein (plasmid) [Phyllobacterium sp. A18/5-2]|uniref:nucleotidyl transferase AbiEii/AbiGii toxin family protein n=1 Tax=Phyllobacterium sp. A18/5-2 TaxID=2978392 RepID=UPI0021C922E2|nr:nucleotidyl transferase AbiEii/AbiGii toxin family protein [Phyllobacterium sp. A18/5-2]UXN67065.1 nucleotidyl transferase AbiEii/AbiGii toxin family protein [Phyllobacterium sp. A18/5-2]